ncbi:serine/threonine-protein kinase [Thermomonospora cellulosilytica]|uniref:Protein kinase domain-containing protein n=1 Tax=Thermomonospora cellulosilytica TaxID=1411118 RepID=A0A7W3R8P9_9ACTN|nr:serine/threonine-protein kinase [Thermomonospora cellulosilytica]MBA9003824.1 hypothetical protein [Thermomonospora cellulosilytica]
MRPNDVFEPLLPDDPAQLGGYRVLARIGAGGMGRVYLAATQSGRRLAIKVVRPEFADDPEFRRRFRQEVTAAQRVQSLYTAPVIDADLDGPRPWMATAYVPGPSLAAVVAGNGPLAPQTVRPLAAGVAEALEAIHRAGIIHRDLKPSNVLLAEDGPRVIDFGIARAADATPLTRTGVRIGTPHFMAPEQALGRPSTPAVDVFALGVLVFFAATGRSPFGEGPDPAVLYRIAREEPDLTGCPDDLRPLIERCLRKDPAARPALRELMDELNPGGAAPEPGWLPSEVTRLLAPFSAAPPPPTGAFAGPPGTPPTAPVHPVPGTPPGGHGMRSGLLVAAGAGMAALLLVPALAFVALSGDSASEDPGRADASASAPTAAPRPGANGGGDDGTQPSPPPSPRPRPTGEPVHLADLTPRGDSLLVGRWSTLGKAYPESLGVAAGCDGENTREAVFDLGGPHRLFVADVGVDDTATGSDRDEEVRFVVYADRDQDGRADEDEEIGVRAARHRLPGHIEADLGGADSVILYMETADICLPKAAAFWGTPRVYK